MNLSRFIQRKKYVILEKHFNRSDREIKHCSENVEPSGVCKADLNEDILQRYMREDRRRLKIITSYLKNGARGILYCHEGRWISHGLIAPIGINLPDHLSADVTEKDWWIFFMHTRLDERGKGLQSRCIGDLLELVEKDSDAYRVRVDVEINNVPSLRAFGNYGFVKIGEVTVKNLRPKKFWKLIIPSIIQYDFE